MKSLKLLSLAHNPSQQGKEQRQPEKSKNHEVAPITPTEFQFV